MRLPPPPHFPWLPCPLNEMMRACLQPSMPGTHPALGKKRLRLIISPGSPGVAEPRLRPRPLHARLISCYGSEPQCKIRNRLIPMNHWHRLLHPG